jgi:nucleoid-associated protein YgaU
MGLVDFVRDAGESLLGRGRTPSEEVANRVRSMGLGVEGLSVDVDDEGKAVLRGRAATQAEKEKAVLVVGNTRGIGQVEDEIEVAAPAPQSQYYRVKSGDTLSKIARQFYGNASK